MRQWLRMAREWQGLTQKGLGNLIGKDITTIGKYENGSRNPTANTAQKIASVLNFDWTLFFTESESYPTDSIATPPSGLEARSNKTIRKGRDK